MRELLGEGVELPVRQRQDGLSHYLGATTFLLGKYLGHISRDIQGSVGFASLHLHDETGGTLVVVDARASARGLLNPRIGLVELAGGKVAEEYQYAVVEGYVTRANITPNEPAAAPREIHPEEAQGMHEYFKEQAGNRRYKPVSAERAVQLQGLWMLGG